jgi:DNA polymerase-3 subunit alpha
MDKRDRVIAYVQKKYGEESVGQIATFAELKAKSVIKDVGRTIGMLPVEQQALANLIPRKTPAETYTIQESLQIEPKLKQRYESEPQVRECLTQASKLEGLIRQAGKHAAGIVISEGALWDHVPVFKDPQTNSYITQYYKDDVEAAGLVKFDFLGLKTLTVLDIATLLIRARAPEFHLESVPLDDKPTYALLASGETKGVFQLESSGMQQLFKDLKADCFEDIVAAVALYRPGPLGSGMVADFVNRKNKRAKVESLHAMVDSILVPTYGVIVYQEQVMQVAQALAGYTLGGADILRRAMGKKKPEEMAKQKGIFVEGATKKGVTQEDAERIFGLLEFFAGYGFNKCVVGSTEIINARTGERTTVRDLFDRRRAFSIHALGEDGKLRARRVTDVMWNGQKRVFKLTTAQGKRITATANHPFKTLDGWKNLGDLRVGDRIAAPRRVGIATSKRWPAHEVIALAGLLSEGNTCHPTCLYFFGNDKKLVDDFAVAASKFPTSVARVYQRPNRALYEVCVSTGRDARFKRGQRPWNARGGAAIATDPTRSGMFEWARELGLLAKKAAEKNVPDPVFELADEDIELFLGRLWAGDGFIANATQFTPFYATSSRALAKSVQTLLLRLGITSGVHEKTFKYRGGTREGFTVHLVGDRAVEHFLARIAPHCIGREAAVSKLDAYVAATPRGKTSKDTIPREISEWVDEDRRAAGLTWTQLEQRSDASMKELCGPSKNKLAYRRSTIAAVGHALRSKRLLAAAESDIFWDRIASIEDAGVEDTFDLTVDVDHNFVADGLIVHNSHSAAYALITYQTAWLKAHYPAELLCAILTSDKDRIEKVVRTIADARAMGITVLPPDINESDTDFKVVYGEETQSKRKGSKKALPQIRFGLGAVRGVGGAALESIFEARKAGKFIDLFDFAARVDAAKINKAVLQALVQCGAFDSTFGALGTSRAQAYASIDVALERLRAATRDRERGQTNLFGLFDASATTTQKWNAPSAGDYIEAAPWDRKEMLARERQSLGFYVSGHPLERYLKGGSALARLEALPASSCNEQQDWAVVKLAGMVEGYRERIFRDGATSNKLAFFELEDLSGRVQVKVRGNQIDSYAHVLTSGEPILLTGKVSFPRRDDDEPEPDAETPREATILLNDAVLLSDVVASSTKQVVLRLHADQIREGTLEKMSRVMRESPGNCGVSLHLVLPTGAEATLSLGPGHRVEIGDALLAGFERIFGSQVAELR